MEYVKEWLQSIPIGRYFYIWGCFIFFKFFDSLLYKSYFSVNVEVEVSGSSYLMPLVRGSPLEVFLGKGVMKICSKFTAERPCRSVMFCNFIEITFWHGCSPVNLQHIFRTLRRAASEWSPSIPHENIKKHLVNSLQMQSSRGVL